MQDRSESEKVKNTWQSLTAITTRKAFVKELKQLTKAPVGIKNFMSEALIFLTKAEA